MRMYEYSEVYVAEMYSRLVASQKGITNVSTASLAKAYFVLPNGSNGEIRECTHFRLSYQIMHYSN